MRRVLFVDDNETVLKTYHKVFDRKSDEWQCFFAADVSAAIDILTYSQIDIVITDLEMPMHNGAQLLAYVQQKFPRVTRIIFSGSQNTHSNMQTVNSAHRFIAKPNTIGELETIIEYIYHLYQTIFDDKTRATISAITTLPALPSVYFELIEEFSSQFFSLRKISELISSDVGLTTEILKMVNSSYFGLGKKVTSPQQAVVLLGGEIVKGLILTAHISRSFTLEEQQFSIETWSDHSLLTATFCQAIAEKEGMSRDLVDLAFVSGLLHDVGRIILATSFPEKYHNVITEATSSKRPLIDVEKEIIGTTHCNIGAYLLGLWGLPDQLVDAVAFHHAPELCENEETRKMVKILHLSDLFTYDLVPDFRDAHYVNKAEEFNTDEVIEWRSHCLNVAIEKGYLEEDTPVADINFD